MTRYRPRSLQITDRVASAVGRVRILESSSQAGNTSVDKGDFVVVDGDVVVEDGDGNVILRILHGTVPEIRLYPVNTPSHRVAMFGWDAVGDGSGAAYSVDVETNAGALDGGALLLWTNGARLAYQPNGEEAAYVWVGYDAAEAIHMRGKWLDQTSVDSRDALRVGSVDVSAGVSSWTHTYAVAGASKIAPIVGLVNTAGTVSWNITAMSTSAFTVTWSGTLAKTINFWNPRL